MTLRRISAEDDATWRELLALAAEAGERPSAANCKMLRQLAQRARRAVFPVDDATARVSFSPLVRRAEAFAPDEAAHLLQLAADCANLLEPRTRERKDVFG